MTTYTANPTSNGQYLNWANASTWREGIVPNSPDADVVIPVVTYTNGGGAITYSLRLDSDQQYSIRSLALNDLLFVDGTLNVSGDIALYGGQPGTFGQIGLTGTINAGSLTNRGYDVQGYGTLNIGAVDNEGTIFADAAMTLNAKSYAGSGSLTADGLLTVNVTPGGFANVQNGTLTGGALTALGGGTLALNIGSGITADGALIQLSGGQITSADPVTGVAVPLTASLRTITPAGTLALSGDSYTFNGLDVAGTVTLTGAVLQGSAKVEQGASILSYDGTIGGTVSNDGVIEVVVQRVPTALDYYDRLKITGDISGSGSIVLGPSVTHYSFYGKGNELVTETPTLEISGTVSENVIYTSSYSKLVLDHPERFTGAIEAVGPGISGEVDLPGIDLSTVTSTSYNGDASGGTLTIAYGGNQSVALRFLGDHALGDFYLYAGPQPLSSSPPSLNVGFHDGTAPVTESGVGTVYGNRGDDTLGDAGGPSTLIGGLGNDTYIVSNTADVLTENPNEGTDTVLASVSFTLPDNVENLTLTGAANINGTGNALDNVIMGNAGNNLLSGGAGNDRIVSGGGRDVVDGGSGNDTLVLTGTRASYAVFTIGSNLYLIGASGGVEIANVESVRFADGQASLASVLATAQPFDATRYLATYPDLAAAFGNNAAAAASHFAQFGFAEGRAADGFSALEYLASNPDLIRAFGINQAAATQHYLQHGIAEGRAVASFDPYEYIASNLDLLRAFGADATAGEAHYIQHGLAEGRATASFDALRYLASNPDLLRLFGDDPVSAERHYITDGYREGRATTSFDALAYAAASPDLARAFGTDRAAAEKHYVDYGYAEGRPNGGFDAVAYALSNPDLGQAGLTIAQDFTHWLTNGAKEGRAGDSLYGREQTNHAAAVGTNTHDTIDTATDHDWLAVTLAAGETVDIGLSAATFDPLLQVYDDHAVLQRQAQGATTGSSATLTFTAAHAGTYYLAASALDAHTGGYDLLVRDHAL